MITRRTLGLACAILITTVVGCEADDYLTPRREPLTLAPLEIATNVAKLSEGHDSYSVDFRGFAQRYLDVSMTVACPSPCRLKMATWTPGSYLIREYARNLSRMTATDASGKPLSVAKLNKNTWEIALPAPQEIRVIYRLYAHELSVRTNFLADNYGIINGASTFLFVERETPRPFRIALVLPDGWSADTGLKKTTTDVYEATSLDELIDSPFIVGEVQSYDFSLSQVPHRLSMVGDLRFWDLKRIGADVERLTEEIMAHWGTIPYESYAYLNVVDHGRGGLEHLDSTLMIAKPLSPRSRKNYLSWLGLVSHEFYHTWNVKRLRPKELGPFDYENENYTRSLWIAEGITSYYDDLMVRRSGLMTDSEYLEKLSKSLAYVENSLGSTVQSLADSSHDAWIKYYRQGENSPNTQTSYYSKGAAVAFLLDMTLRRVTNERVSLDTLMTEAYTRFSKDGFTTQEFRDLTTELAGTSMEKFFAKYVDGTAPLEHEPALQWMGLRWKAQSDSKVDEGYPAKGWAGWKLKEDGGVFISVVEEEGPAHRTGIAPGDELIAIDGYRARTMKDVTTLLESLGAGASVKVSLSRRNRILTLKMGLKAEPKREWKLEEKPKVSKRIKRRRARWLASRVARED